MGGVITKKPRISRWERRGEHPRNEIVEAASFSNRFVSWLYACRWRHVLFLILASKWPNASFPRPIWRLCVHSVWTHARYHRRNDRRRLVWLEAQLLIMRLRC